MPATNLLPADLVRALFRYDKETGELFWRIKSKKPSAARPRGRHRKDRSNELGVCIAGVFYMAHNIIWIYMTGSPPNGEVDHKNRNQQDNRWCNLREATRSQNQANTGKYKNNKTGYRGVHQIGSTRFRAMISIDGKNRALGTYSSAEQAHEAWKAAALTKHGDFASL